MLNKTKLLIKQAHLTFAIIAMISGLLFMVLTPPLWGLDEQAHFARAYKITEGSFISNTDANNPANSMPTNFSELFNYRVHDILDVVKNGSILDRKDVTDSEVYTAFGSQKFSESRGYFPVIANYSPVAYPGPVFAILVAKLLNLSMGMTLLLARLLSLVAYIVIVAVALWLLRSTKVKWLIFSLALLPTSIFQAAVVTADNTMIAISILFFSALISLFVTKNPRDKIISKWILAITSILAPLTKANQLFISLVLLFIPAKLLGGKKQSIRYKVAVIAVMVVAAVGWSFVSQVTQGGSVTQRADQAIISPSSQIEYAMTNPHLFAEAIIRSLISFGDAYFSGLFITVSGNSIRIPIVIAFMLVGALLLTAFYAKDDLKNFRKINTWLSVLALLTSLSIFGALYAGFTPLAGRVVEGVQGRYFLPLLLPLIMMIAYVTPISLKTSDRSISIIATSTAAFSLFISILYIGVALY